MPRPGGSGLRVAVAILLAWAGVAGSAATARAQCGDVFVDALQRLVRRSFDLRKTCEAIERRGGTCSFAAAEAMERQRFAAAVRASCTRAQLEDLGVGGCAAEAADGRPEFIACAQEAAAAQVQRMLAPIFGLDVPGPTVTPTGPTPSPTVTGPSMPPTPTPTPRCGGINESCFGPGIDGCCAPLVCRISGMANRQICTVRRGSPAGAFLDEVEPGF